MMTIMMMIMITVIPIEPKPIKIRWCLAASPHSWQVLSAGAVQPKRLKVPGIAMAVGLPFNRLKIVPRVAPNYLKMHRSAPNAGTAMAKLNSLLKKPFHPCRFLITKIAGVSLTRLRTAHKSASTLG